MTCTTHGESPRRAGCHWIFASRYLVPHFRPPKLARASSTRGTGSIPRTTILAVGLASSIPHILNRSAILLGPLEAARTTGPEQGPAHPGGRVVPGILHARKVAAGLAVQHLSCEFQVVVVDLHGRLRSHGLLRAQFWRQRRCITLPARPAGGGGLHHPRKPLRHPALVVGCRGFETSSLVPIRPWCAGLTASARPV